jgi:hypothetical protein
VFSFGLPILKRGDMDGLTASQLKNVRSVDIEGQVYYSILDLIGFSTGKTQYVHSWWGKFKSRSSNSPIQWKKDVLNSIKLAPLVALDNKKRRTEVITLEAFNIFYTRHLERVVQVRQERTSTGNDEVINFHPVVEEFLEANGWDTIHHVAVASGRVFDFLAVKNFDETLVVECKMSLMSDDAVYKTTGQVLCYLSEYKEYEAKPAIAVPKDQISHYARECCKSLGITLLEIDYQYQKDDEG